MEEIIEGQIARTSNGRIVIPGDMLAHVICNAIEEGISDGLVEELKDIDLIVESNNTLHIVRTVPMVA